jgi:hypothetical protein
VSVFTTQDQTVYLWFTATVTSADSVTSDWLAPDGSVVPGVSWSAYSGTACFTGAKLAIGSLPTSKLGSWQARVYNHGSQWFSVPFTVGQAGNNALHIASVTPILPHPNQTFIITGSGFGTYKAYNGTSQYLEISDLTGQWNAGFGNNPVALNVTSWSDSQIVVQGFTGAYGQNNWVLRAGDQIQVQVWNPQTNAQGSYQTTCKRYLRRSSNR